MFIILCKFDLSFSNVIAHSALFSLDLSLGQHREHLCERDPVNALFVFNCRMLLYVWYSSRKCGPLSMTPHML